MEFVKWNDYLGRENILMEGRDDDIFYSIPDKHDEEGNSYTVMMSKKALIEFVNKLNNN